MAVGVQAPARLGRYELLARLATGGMGEIFLARLEGAAGFEKLYVVKRILPHLADDARFRAMLIAEARIASRLSHSNICQVYELGETDGQLYIVMEYLEGVTVLPMLRRSSRDGTPLDFGLVGAILQQASEALHYAHELKDRSGESLGIVHRDVTPSNIFLTDAGVAKVLDFGIAKVKDASAHTQTGTVKGKYAYMAPEQLRGVSVDRRADVFALAVVTFEMLALRRLFQRKTDYLTFRAVMEQPIPDVRRYRPDVPDAVAIQLARALDREPANRFDTVRQLATALIDAMTPIERPWTQGELSDYILANYSSEITKRSEQVSSAVHRTKPTGSGGRTTMPMIEAEQDPDSDDEYDLEFPPVETTASDAPIDARAASSDFNTQTPPPFGVDSSTSGYQLQPLPPAYAAAKQKRNVFWPILATVMVGITGVALFLVWQQMQKPQQPTNITFTSEPNPDPGPTPGSADNPVEPASQGSAVAPPTTGSGGKRPTPPPRPRPNTPRRSAYDDAIALRRTQLQRCATDHGPPPANASILIVVTTAGKAKTVSLQPADLNASKLGACIKNVLSTVKYPSATAEMNVEVPLKTS